MPGSRGHSAAGKIAKPQGMLRFPPAPMLAAGRQRLDRDACRIGSIGSTWRAAKPQETRARPAHTNHAGRRASMPHISKHGGPEHSGHWRTEVGQPCHLQVSAGSPEAVASRCGVDTFAPGSYPDPGAPVAHVSTTTTRVVSGANPKYGYEYEYQYQYRYK